MEELERFKREPFNQKAIPQNWSPQIHTSKQGEFKILLTFPQSYNKDSEGFIFHLMKGEEIVEDYTPHLSSGHIHWTPDDKYVIVQIGTGPFGYLIHDISKHRFCLIKFKTPHRLNVIYTGLSIVFKFPEHKSEKYNSDYQGITRNELPIKHYQQPPDLEFQLDELTFSSKTQLSDIFYYSNALYSLKPIHDGYLEFTGRLPQDTVQGYNGQDFKLYQLKHFGDFGDLQSKLWYDENLAKHGPNLNLYNQKVSDFLGYREREV